VGDCPWSVAVGDFNGDGKLDLATANSGFGRGHTVSILLGDGKGNFTLASTPAAGYGPQSIVTGDFNGDGKVDLTVAGGDEVSILLGDGTGNFTLGSYNSSGRNARSVAVGDFNGDGNLDLAAANWGDHQGAQSTVSIFLGDGAGNLTFASSLQAGLNPYSLAVGDFNGDNKLDVAEVNYCGNQDDCFSAPGTLIVFLGDGSGNFNTVSTSTIGYEPNSVVVGDFNGDGKLDLAINHWASGIFILLGDGTGNFTLTFASGVLSNSTSVATADFNGDGRLDLAVTYEGYSVVSILLGDGAGDFTLSSNTGMAGGAEGIGVGDFNGDGKLDLAAPNWWINQVSILLGAPPTPEVTLSPGSLTFATQLVFTASSPQMVILTNTGNAPLNITSIVPSANFADRNNCGSSLAAGASCTIGVVFKPHKVGTITGTITITDNAPNSPQTISLTGVATGAILSPSNLDFGNQPVGTTSPPQTVTLTNYSDRAGTIFGGELTGANPSQFVLQNTSCGGSLPPGGSCTISIAFAPKTAGTKAATLEVRDNDPASPQTVSLSGTGTQ
jgi:hypothetical protein